MDGQAKVQNTVSKLSHLNHLAFSDFRGQHSWHIHCTRHKKHQRSKQSSTTGNSTEQNEGEKKMEKIKKFLKEEDGVTAIEYTLIAAVIALGIVASVGLVQGWITTRMTQVSGIGT
jgi:pilus assembly protein Flp/PilA